MVIYGKIAEHLRKIEVLKRESQENMRNIEVLTADKLASLQGHVAGGTKTIWVVAQSRKQARIRRVRADAAGYYILENLLPGAYAIFAFEDQNANGLQDYGSLEPFEPAEPYSRYLENVNLSAGARAEGIDLEFP